jgi:DNA processing protein
MGVSKVHWAALAAWAGIGGRTMTALLQHFGSLEPVFSASELVRVRHIGPQTAAAITSLDLPAIEAALAGFASAGVSILTWEDAEYPANLLRSQDAPPVLFVRGALAEDDVRAVAVVGTRSPSASAVMLARTIAAELAVRGWTIVSGLALGIDTAAHRGALEAGGRTLAVLGGGVLNVYPPANAALAEAVMRSGALLCEAHPQAEVNRQSLIARNRITSGLSRAVIVVQSGEDSGSMSTARRAREQGRAVLAVRGGDAGCDSLIAEGAEELRPDDGDWDALSARLNALPPSGARPAGQPRLF